MLDKTIVEDYKNALRAKDDMKKSALNYIIAQIKNKQIELQKEPTDEDVVAILKKEIKARQESVSYLEQAEKLNDVAYEKGVIELLSTYLPEMLSKTQLTELVKNIITSQGITDVGRQRGEIVKAIMADHKASVDGRLLQEVIGEVM